MSLVSAARIAACTALLGLLLLAPSVSEAQATDRVARGYYVLVSAPGQAPLKLYAEEAGRGPPVLLLHGLGGSIYTWHKVLPALATSHRVIALDLKGFGRSDKPLDRAYSIADHATLVESFIRRRGLVDLTLVGHSLGGAVALEVALDYSKTDQGRIGRLVLIDTPAFAQPISPSIAFLNTPVLPYLALIALPPEIPTALTLMEVHGEVMFSEKDIRNYAAPLYDFGARHALITTARQIVPPNLAQLTRRYPTLQQPTLLIWCRADTVVPLTTGLRLQRNLPHARLEILEGCVHLPHESRPAKTIQLIRQFLAQSTWATEAK